MSYNQREFVAQAIDSALGQDVDFDYEIVIGDDASTDGTRELLADYSRNYPDRIHLLVSEKNGGAHENFERCLNSCRGEYVALLEGDDFWTSPLKLRKQVEYLSTHPEYASCFHDVYLVRDDCKDRSSQTQFSRYKPPQPMVLENVVTSFCIPTCSTMFRRAFFSEYPKWFHDMSMGDWPLHIVLAERGPIGYVDKVMAAYRIHEGGVWSSQKRLQVLERSICACRVIDNHLAGRFRAQLARRIAILEYEAAILLLRELRFGESLSHFVSGFVKSPIMALLHYPAKKFLQRFTAQRFL